MAEYLLEVGCEEIPATMIARAVDELGESLVRNLRGDGVAVGEHRGYGGPRRIAVHLTGMSERQPDREERLTGPPADKAFDADGRPTRAGIGFAAKLGIPPEQLERIETARGTCVGGIRQIPGRAAAEVLAELVPKALHGLSFRKTMRWGEGEHRFVRAVRWLVSVLDGQIVPFEFAGITAGRISRGHRFLGAAEVELDHAGGYPERLAAEHVVAAAELRSSRLLQAMASLAAGCGGTVDDDPGLLEEVIYFVEEPHAIVGRFDEDFLGLPQEVLVTSMKHHQKSFPVWDPSGKLLARFIAVANIPDVEGHVQRGFERVLRARLADARFFWDEDRKRPLSERSAELSRVVFQEKLGSYAAKTRRLEGLAPAVARGFAMSESAVAAASAAAALAKLDLTTGIVGEFPELQGIAGGLYIAAEAPTDGHLAEVSRAVYEHYLPTANEGPLPASDAGAAVAIADKLDTLVGCFGVDLIPSGTKDPLGLRRAALGIVRIVLERGHDVDLEPLLARAAELHQGIPGAVAAAQRLAEVGAYLGERLEHVLRQAEHRPDTIEAVLAVAPLRIVDVERRARALTAARQEPGFEQTFTVFKRVVNIAGSGPAGGYREDPAAPAAEQQLWTRLQQITDKIDQASRERNYPGMIGCVRELGEPLNDFFDQVLVMDPDPTIRDNRLQLLRTIAALVAPIGDFARLQVERERKATQ